jgi:hypothetical protein
MLCWDGDDRKVTKVPRIPFRIKYQILLVFRIMQRCCTWDDWPAAKAQFLQEVHTIIFSQGSVTLEPGEIEDTSHDKATDVETESRSEINKHKNTGICRHMKITEGFAGSVAFCREILL